MSCDNCKCHCLQPIGATLVQGVSATITVATVVLENNCKYRLRYCVKFTDAVGVEMLQITSGAVTIPVWDRCGNPVTIGKLRKRELLKLEYSSIAPIHFTLCNPLCCQKIKTPEIVVAAE